MDIEAVGIRVPHEAGMVVYGGGGGSMAVVHPGSDPTEVPHRTTSLPLSGPSFANMLRRMVRI